MSQLTLRQTIEGMTLGFNPTAAENLDAVIQFDISGDEHGTYHLRIANDKCTFHFGQAESPTLTIASPSEVWLKISTGELLGQEALMQGLYKADGDLGLLLKMNALFKSVDDVSIEATDGARPAGPIQIKGMAWMAVGFVPWIIYWVTFDMHDVSNWIKIGLPLLLSILIVGYRETYHESSWLDKGGVVFFSIAGLFILLGNAWFATWGSVVSSLVMGALWLGTLPFAEKPMSTEYSKWEYIKPLWRNSMFIYPNAVISLMWGWQFMIASLVGIGSILLPSYAILLTILRYLLLIPAFIFTSAFPKRAMEYQIENHEATMTKLSSWAIVGLVAIAVILIGLVIL
ncbi:MAG: hypothetical protein B6242_03120 [Anaerolineaceae bacterium 4572_78]|nr:MAG: hypothetical protein B6242_03120 [Anaerolineaceae bacterium 4572_78]